MCAMKVRTVRQIKQQQRHQRLQAGSDSIAPVNSGRQLESQSSYLTAALTKLSLKSALKTTESPPYKMPPLPLNESSSNAYTDAQIPGMTLINDTQPTVSSVSLRTHSSKFPIERELILSSDKASSKIPLMHESRTPSGIRRAGGIPLLSRQPASIAPDHPPKQAHAWQNSQHSNQQEILQQQQQQQHQPVIQQTQSSSLTGAISRTPARLPEDVTALADRDNVGRDRDGNKNAVTKTYHTLKDLISSKFKKDNTDVADELNNVVVHQQTNQSQTIGKSANEEFRMSSHPSMPSHMRQMQNLNQSQPNIAQKPNGISNINGDALRKSQQEQRAASQPQLNLPAFERRNSTDIVTDSDDGGFKKLEQSTRPINRRPQTMYHLSTPPTQPPPHPPAQHYQSFSSLFQHQYLNNQPNQYQHLHTHQHQSPSQPQVTPQPHSQSQTAVSQLQPQQSNQNGSNLFTGRFLNQGEPMTAASSSIIQSRQDAQRSSFQKRLQDTESIIQHDNASQQPTNPPKLQPSQQRMDGRQTHDPNKNMPGSANSSDYDKSGNQSSNVDSGRGSAAYSSGRKGPQLDTESSDSPLRDDTKNDDSEWVDIVDAELRHILDPGVQALSLRPESTVSGSVSSISPPLPPLSPDNTYKMPSNAKDPSKQEYGTDSYNRPGRGASAIGPSRAGWPGSAIHKQGGSYGKPSQKFSGKKHEQAVLKRHLFGLDNDLTSNTTRSLDLESLLGGAWGTAQSVSDSETDTQGIRHIRSQLEGLEHMYGEVLKMLGKRSNFPARLPEQLRTRGAGIRRRHGSLSSLPSSSISGRPIRDRRRIEERRKIKDVKGINKRFQRLESHVVTLARSVAHLSSEMRSQHLVTQELEKLRDDFTALSRAQAARTQNLHRSTANNNNTNNTIAEPEPPNLTNPKRVKKLTKFFGEPPPLMRIFLRSLGYEKYANLFENERVGMIELPYLGEERLQKMGIPLGPRLRILQEAQISLCKDTTLCIV